VRCIIDANILIDLSRGNLLTWLFALPFQFAAPDGVLDELVEPDRERLRQMGMQRAGLSTGQLLEAARLSVEHRQLSLGDCTALIAARDTQVVLLIGDAGLRALAQEHGVVVHGVLWVLDELEDAGLLNGSTLAASLRRMLAEGARLPADECSARLKRWENT
jgi:predicted nucleic acid-binding protein